MVFSRLKVLQPFIMFYYKLIHIHQDKSSKCWNALRFSVVQNHAFIAYLCVPSLRPGTNLNQALADDAFTSAALTERGSWWACWQDTNHLSQQPPPLPLFPTYPSRT